MDRVKEKKTVPMVKGGAMLSAKEAPVKGNQSDAIQRVLSSLFWKIHYLCVLCGGIYCVTMGVTSMVAGPLICGLGELLCPLVWEWGTIALVLQCDVQHTSYANISMWRAT